MEILVNAIIRKFAVLSIMSTYKTTKVSNIILLILLGVIAFSNISVIILQNIFRINVVLPELLFFPFVVFLWNTFKEIKVNRAHLLVMLIIWVVLFFVGNSQYSQGSIFTHARGFLYIFLFAIIFKEKETRIDGDTIFYIALGSLIGWFASCILGNFMPESRGFTYGNLLAIPLFLSMSYVKEKKDWFYIGVLLILLITFLAGLRRVIIVFIASLILVLLVSSFRKNKNRIIPLITLSLFGVVIFSMLDTIGKVVYNFSPIIYYRVFERTSNSIETTINSDEERMGNFEYFQDHMFEELVPSGFLKTWGDEFGRFNDFPVFQLSYTFGIIISAFILFFIIKCLFASIRKMRNNDEAYIYVVVTIVMFILLFLDGSFLVNAYITPFTGLCIGKIILFSKQSNLRRYESISKIINSNS